jgi:hypothetical protein
MGQCQVQNTTGVVGTGTVFGAQSPVVVTGGTITTAIGVDIEAQKVAGVTTGFGIRQRGSADLNSFAGPTSFASNVGFWGVSPAPQSTGWSVTPGYTVDKAFSPESCTVTELARVVGTLLDVLKSYGMLG